MHGVSSSRIIVLHIKFSVTSMAPIINQPIKIGVLLIQSYVKQWLFGTLSTSHPNHIDTWCDSRSIVESHWRPFSWQQRSKRNKTRESTQKHCYRWLHCYGILHTHIKAISDLLTNIGSKVPERTLVTYALNGLSSKFDHIATTIRHRNPFPTLLKMRSMLSIEEQTL